MQCVVQQVSTIQHGHNLYARRQNLIVEFVYFFVNSIERGPRIRALAQQHGPLNHCGIINHDTIFAMNGPRHCAEQNPWPLLHLCNVFYAQSCSTLGGKNSVFDVLYGGEEAYGSHIELLLPLLYKTSACIHVVIGELLLNLPNA